MKLQSTLENYLEDLKTDGRSQYTIKNYKSTLKPFITYLETKENEYKCKEVINEYKRVLNKERDINLNSLATYTTIIKGFMEYQGHNCSDVKVPKAGESFPKYLSKKEIKKLLNAPNGIYQYRDKAILYLLYSSGLRVSELTALNIEDIDFESGRITVNAGKGNKSRITFTDTSTLDLINKMIYKRTRKGREVKKEDYKTPLFIKWYFRRLGVKSVQRIVYEAKKKAGIKKRVTPHILRHSFATNKLQDDMSIKAIQQLLGHKSLATTSIYTQINDKDLEKQYKEVI